MPFFGALLLGFTAPVPRGIKRRPLALAAAELVQSDAFVSMVIIPVTAAELATVIDPSEFTPVPANRQRLFSAVSFDVAIEQVHRSGVSA